MIPILLLDQFEENNMEKRIATIISYPKSGSTWFSYCVEYLTGIKVMTGIYDSERQDFGMNSISDVFISMIRTELIAVPKTSLTRLTRTGSLIYLIRNPAALYLRDDKDKWWGFKLRPKSFKGRQNLSAWRKTKKNLKWDTFQGITDVATFYDDWQDKKIIIKYEDLIENIGKVILEISTILPVRKNRVEEFLNNIDMHRDNCKNIYENKMSQKSYKIDNPNSHLEGIDLDNILAEMEKYPLVKKLWKEYYDTTS